VLPASLCCVVSGAAAAPCPAGGAAGAGGFAPAGPGGVVKPYAHGDGVADCCCAATTPAAITNAKVNVKTTNFLISLLPFFSDVVFVCTPIYVLMRTIRNQNCIPLLVRRGGCGIKKISAKPTLAPQTGWSLTPKCWLVSDHPGRCRGHPSSPGGEYPSPQFPLSLARFPFQGLGPDRRFSVGRVVRRQ